MISNILYKFSIYYSLNLLFISTKVLSNQLRNILSHVFKRLRTKQNKLCQNSFVNNFDDNNIIIMNYLHF